MTLQDPKVARALDRMYREATEQMTAREWPSLPQNFTVARVRP